MSKRIFPNWNTFGVTRDKAWMARQAAARAAARGTVIQRYRAQNVRMQGPPARLPVTVNIRAPGEMKSVDVPDTGVSFNTSTTFSATLLNGVAPGTARYQRVGNKITPQLIDIQGYIQNTSTTAGFVTSARVAVIWDRQPTGTLPTIDDIYQNVSSSGATSTGAWPGRNMNTTDRFLTIASQDYFLHPTVAAAGGKYAYDFHFIRSLKHLAQQFKGSDALLASIATGALYVVAFSHDATDANPTFLHFDARFKYTDL